MVYAVLIAAIISAAILIIMTSKNETPEKEPQCELGLPESCAQEGKERFKQDDFAEALRYASQGCAGGIFESCIYEAVAAGRLEAAAPDLKKRQEVLLTGCKEHNNAMACYEYAMTLPTKSQKEVGATLSFLYKACDISKNQEYCNMYARHRRAYELPWQPVKSSR